MNLEEGGKKMVRAGQWLFVVPSTLSIFIWAVALIGASQHSGLGMLFSCAMILAVLAIYLAIAGGALWLAGWIVEGFAKDTD